MNKSLTAKERIFAQAEKDYQPALVALDAEAIARLPIRAERFGRKDGTTIAETAAPETEAARSIAFNSLNFLFWTPAPKGVARYQWGEESGAQALKAAFDQVWGGDATPGRLRELFGAGDESAVVAAMGDIPMPRRRAHFLREILAGDQLEQAAAELVKAGDSGRLSSDDAERLAQRFPLAYGQDPYRVRAQLALMQYAGYLEGRGTGPVCDITIAAGCQMPRIMRSIKVLRFAPELAAKIDSHTLILRNSDDERAIRAATVLGAQEMARHLGVSEHTMVNVLWQNRNACGDMPHHLTITTDY